MKRAIAVTCLLLAACGNEPVSDWERRNPELLSSASRDVVPTPPPPPRRENLIEFYVSATATFRYFIDAASLSVNYKQREVRYVMVARSPSGVENTSFEALRCPDQHRVYATATDDGKWNLRASDWQETVRRGDRSWASALARQYFCPHNDPIQSVAEGVDALRRGAHPQVYVEQLNRGR